MFDSNSYDTLDNYEDREREAAEMRASWSEYYLDEDELDFMEHQWAHD